MHVGVTLPQFRLDPAAALAAARSAEEAGLDGVFVFDHVWPLGRPDRPALAAWPLLGALAVETRRVAIGTLVARVGLLPDAVLVNAFAGLHRIVGDRLIAGIGTGDRASEPENRAYRIPYLPAADRLRSLAGCCASLRSSGITTWVGGRSAATRAVAEAGGHALNVWGVTPADVAGLVRSTGAEVTWGGPVPAEPGPLGDLLGALAAAGATWAVCARTYPPGDAGAAAGAVAALAEVAAARP